MAILNIYFVIIVASLIRLHSTISPERSSSLNREQFHFLDSDVKDFYNESYEDLDSKNVSFDDQLFRSLRSIRHTIVINLHDFKYTSEEYKLQAIGSSVDKELCKKQLYILAELARKVDEQERGSGSSRGVSPPLSVIDFLDSSARTGSGILNGNFVWLGSSSSCERAKIPSNIIETYLNDYLKQSNNHLNATTIKGRYCVAHLKAKSWPKWDIYFEDRLTLRKGVCLPETCHSLIYEQDVEIKQLVDYISRYNLVPPFNQDDRYETTSLYCLPDEDSPYRQWDFGSKMFFLYVTIWILITIWANMKYYRRIETMQKLRETIDIKMIINEKLDDDILIDYNQNQRQQKLTNNQTFECEGDDERDEEEEVKSKTFKVATSGSESVSIKSSSKFEHEESEQIKREAAAAAAAPTTTIKRKGSKAKLNKAFLQAGARQLRKQFQGLGSNENDVLKKSPSETKLSELDREDQEEKEVHRMSSSQNSLFAANVSAQSSLATTPLPSDIDETDVEFIKALQSGFDGEEDGEEKSKLKHRKKSIKKNINYNYKLNSEDKESSFEQRADASFDWVRAFCLELNYKFLVQPRFERQEVEQQPQHNDERVSRSSAAHIYSSSADRLQRSLPQLAAVARRTSSSNDRLIKELQQQDSGIAIIAKTTKQQQQQQQDSDNIGQQQQQHHEKSNESGKVKRRVNIEVLDGLKVIATSYIVFGHTLMFFFGCTNDIRFANERMLDLTMAASINTLQVVGLFYLITGCLLTYLSFSKTKLKHLLSPSFWLFVMIGRYFRLLPAYMIVFWFSRHVAPLMGVGRDWYDYRTDIEHPRGFCAQESWWTMWTMSAADIKIPMDCIPQAWYLSDDFRTLLVLPLYVYLLARNVFLGYAAIFATFAFCNMKLINVLQTANIDYKILLAWQPHVYSLMADRLHDVYTDFYVRISTYLLGVVIGHILYLYEIRKIKELPKILRLIGMKITIFAGIFLYFGARIISNPYVNQFLPSPNDLTSDVVVLLIPLFKGLMELCLCVMILLLVTGGGSKFIRDFLSCPTMKILSNISYGVFLTHVEVMYKLPGNRFESSYAYLLLYAVFFITTSHIVAFLLHLLYEMPINYMLRHLFKKAFASLK